jgi:hypothetical protein
VYILVASKTLACDNAAPKENQDNVNHYTRRENSPTQGNRETRRIEESHNKRHSE